MKSCASLAPNPTKALHALSKTAGAEAAGWGALVGALIGQVSQNIPQIEALRLSQPQLYAATLGAAVAALTSGDDDKRRAEPSLMPSPGGYV